MLSQTQMLQADAARRIGRGHDGDPLLRFVSLKAPVAATFVSDHGTTISDY